MARTRPDHRERILQKLREHGPLSFTQIKRYLQIADRIELDYDLRRLRGDGFIASVSKLWEVVE